MKSLQLFILALLLWLFMGCEPEPNLCEGIECGPGVCVEGSCDCPDGFSGEYCEVEECFGVGCVNGDCDPQTETCICDPNYYGEGCDILCVNGEFANGDCNCSIGYEGKACTIESRCRFIGWWGCEQWTFATQVGGAATTSLTLGSIKFEEGFKTFEVELFPTANSEGLMLLSSNKRIVGKVTENRINFEFQQITTESTVYGSARLGDDQYLRMELFVFNPETSLTEVAKGTFILARSLK